MNLKRLNWKTVGIVAGSLVALALIVQSCRVIRAERALAGDRVLVVRAQQEANDARVKEAVAVAAKTKADGIAKQITDEANRKIAAKEKERAAEHAKLIEAQTKIKTLTGDQLASDIGFRIGEDEIKAVVAGGFSLTRTGGERTFSIFLGGEQTTRDLAAEKEISAGKDEKLSAVGQQVAARDATIMAKDTTIGGLEGTVDAMGDQIHDLELSRVVKFWKGFATGTLFGAAIVAGLKLFGVWK